MTEDDVGGVQEHQDGVDVSGESVARVRRPVKRRAPRRRSKEGGKRRPRRRKKKRPYREIEELPSLTYLIGGEQAKWLIPAAFAALLVFSAWGGLIDWQREYADVPDDFDGTPREFHDCIMVHNTYGDRNSTTHDPSHPDNVACAEKNGEDPNYSELEYQAWLEDFLASVAVDTGNHSGYVWSEGGIATMAYLGSTMGSNMSVYYDPAPGDEFNATHLAIWNSATVAFGGGNDSFEDLLPGGGSAMALYLGPGGIVVDKPTGYIWTEVGIATMSYLWALNGANMSMYGDPVAGDVFTEAHLNIWNGATVAFGGGNDAMADLVPGGGTALAMYVGAGGIVQWSNLSTMPMVTNVTVTPASPGVDDDLACMYDFVDPQGDADASVVRWYVNNVSAGSDSSALTLASGDAVKCSVLPSDGINPGFRVHSDNTPVV